MKGPERGYSAGPFSFCAVAVANCRPGLRPLVTWLHTSAANSGLAEAKTPSQHTVLTGGPEGIRTPDLRFRKPLLYPAELRDPRVYLYPRGGFLHSLSWLFLEAFMFNSVRLPHRLDKQQFAALSEPLREKLLDAQYELLERKKERSR